MPLSDRDIFEEIECGNLVFDPEVELNQVSASSIDLRLADVFTVPKLPPDGMFFAIDPSVISPEAVFRDYAEVVTVPSGDKFELKPGAFVLGYTLEKVSLPNHLAARIEGRSSMARLGVSVHQTAPTVQANFSGQLRLEISNVGPYTVLLEPGTRFCQLIVEKLSSAARSTNVSQFQNQGSST